MEDIGLLSGLGMEINFLPLIERFVDFGEIYVNGDSTMSDLGLYEVGLAPDA